MINNSFQKHIKPYSDNIITLERDNFIKFNKKQITRKKTSEKKLQMKKKEKLPILKVGKYKREMQVQVQKWGHFFKLSYIKVG